MTLTNTLASPIGAAIPADEVDAFTQFPSMLLVKSPDRYKLLDARRMNTFQSIYGRDTNNSKDVAVEMEDIYHQQNIQLPGEMCTIEAA